jgi:hypothetical protein
MNYFEEADLIKEAADSLHDCYRDLDILMNTAVDEGYDKYLKETRKTVMITLALLHQTQDDFGVLEFAEDVDKLTHRLKGLNDQAHRMIRLFGSKKFRNKK